jgi:hypothetical protein
MGLQRTSSIGVSAGCCLAALLLIGVATSASGTSSTRQSVVAPVSVERTGKGDRLTRFKGSRGASDAIAVELSGPSDVVIRDRDGNILFAVDHAARTMTVGEQRRRRATVPDTPRAVESPLPDGCEGAFSPYTDPARAHIIGRCVSSVFTLNNPLA